MVKTLVWKIKATGTNRSGSINSMVTVSSWSPTYARSAVSKVAYVYDVSKTNSGNVLVA